MKFEKVLDQLNSLEKNSFLKIIDNIINNSPKNSKEIEEIIEGIEGQLKDAEHENITKIFQLIEEEYSKYIYECQRSISSQVDILIDIIIRDGNCLMSREWLTHLYNNEIERITTKVGEINKALKSDHNDIPVERTRDYDIYKSCLHTAYYNDLENGLDEKITSDEQSILHTLAKKLDLSQDEVKLLNYLIIPIQKHPIDDIIKELKDLGLIFYSRKNNLIYIPDELVHVLRKVRGKVIADKHFRKILKKLKDSHINQIARIHNIDRKLSIEEKVNTIISEGIDFRAVLLNDIFKDGTTKTEKKNFINDLIEKDLLIELPTKGATAEDKIENLIKYFDDVDNDEKVGISIDGYQKLLDDASKVITNLENLIKAEFEIQEESILETNLLLDYNIKPMDILYLLSKEQLKEMCTAYEISFRGDEIKNIMESYKDAENILLENYALIANRDIIALKQNGILIKEVELGLKFEELTARIFELLGFNIDENLKININNNKSKIDIVINLGNNEIIIVECKTNKDKEFNKFSSVSRQIQSYLRLAEENGYRVIKSLLIAPEFSEDFEKECGLEYELNLSLISANTLKIILDGFKNSRHKHFPYKLLLRDVVIKEDRILLALKK